MVGGIFRRCTRYARLGTRTSLVAVVLLLAADGAEAAAAAGLMAVGLWLLLTSLEVTRHEDGRERRHGEGGWFVDVFAPFDPDVAERGAEPGLGRLPYAFQQVLGLVVAYWISFEIGEDAWSEVSRPIRAWLVAPFSTGLVYAAATVVAVALVLVTNPLGSRARLMRRLAPLLTGPAGFVVVCVALSWLVPAVDEWQAPAETSSPPGGLLLYSVILILLIVTLIAVLVATWGVLLNGITAKFNAHRHHPVVPPVADLCVAAAGLVTIFVRNGSDPLDRWTLTEELVTVVLLVGFAAFDLHLQRRRFGRGRLITP